MRGWTPEEIDREVEKTKALTHAVNELIEQRVDARAIMGRLATIMVQLERQLQGKYRETASAESYIAVARNALSMTRGGEA